MLANADLYDDDVYNNPNQMYGGPEDISSD